MKDKTALDAFIAGDPDSEALKRALAVEMTLKGFSHRHIVEVLEVSSGFVTKWKQRYLATGVAAFEDTNRGRRAYLTPKQRDQVHKWVRRQKGADVKKLADYLASSFGVRYRLVQSYYALLNAE